MFEKVCGVLPLLLALALAPELAYASSADAGNIYTISVEQGKVFFHSTGTRSAVPACGSQYSKRWVFNAATPEGQAMQSFLLTMYAQGKKITVTGTGACTDWSDTETVRFVMGVDSQ